MRIEYEGTVEVQPPYQHVGYTAAGIINGYSRPEVGLSLLYAIAVIALVAWLRGLRLADKPSQRARETLLALTIVLAFVPVFVGVYPPRVLRPEFTATLLSLERASARVEQWAAENSRLPTQAEWPKQVASAADRDGWGNSLGYRLLAAPDPNDGQRYQIYSRGRPGEGRKLPAAVRAALQDDHEIPGSWLGHDGLSGTDDDAGELKSALRRVPRPLRSHSHAREARR